MKGFKHWFVPPAPATDAFRVHGIGVLEIMPPCMINRPSGTSDYLFMYFYDGVTVEQDGQPRAIPPRSFRVWEPRVPQLYGNQNDRWNHSWIHCDGPVVADQLREAQIPLNQVLSLEEPALVEKSLLQIHDELTSQSAPDPVIVRNLFQNMLHGVVRTLEGGGSFRSVRRRIPERFLTMKKYMEAHFVEPLTLEHLADCTNLSVPHFCSEFRKHFAVPPVEYLIRLRMHAAMYYLPNINHSVSEVARLVGYDDLYYFSKLFKKRYGLSPRAMRNRMMQLAAASEARPPHDDHR